MPIPTYDKLMLPVMKRCQDKTWVMKDLIAQMSNDLHLTDDERMQMIPSGSVSTIASRVHWAKTYLKQAGLLHQPRRGVVQITPAGLQFLATNPVGIDPSVLQKSESFQSFISRKKLTARLVAPEVATPAAPDTLSTPDEQIALAEDALDASLRDALLARMLEASPSFFERMILDLLLAMGYGGLRPDAGRQLGGTGDGGVDGVIHEDQLGLDRVYLQAKRYKPGNTVGSETVQAFIGALVGRGATKGVLITTSAFSKAAVQAASQAGALRVALIDGGTLTQLLVRHDVGVRVKKTISIKSIDLGYFDESETE